MDILVMLKMLGDYIKATKLSQRLLASAKIKKKIRNAQKIMKHTEAVP
jgi:hypothetical protein